MLLRACMRGEKMGTLSLVVVLILESSSDCAGGEDLVRQGRTAADGLVSERPLPKIGTGSTSGPSRRMSVAISARHQEHGRRQQQCQREQQQQQERNDNQLGVATAGKRHL